MTSALVLPEWNRKDGDCEYHYKRKPEGHRCLWTVRWNSAAGIITPDHILPIAEATPKQLLAELQDAACAAGSVGDVARRLVANHAEKPDCYQVRKYLAELRKSAREYVCSWLLPEKTVHYWVMRPGWNVTREQLEAHKKAFPRARR